MPTWNDILIETNLQGSTHDFVRRRYLKALHDLTKRNVIVYYSGWLQKYGLARARAVDFSINDSDKNGFMATIHELERDKGLDLILHTPGGDMAATESLVDYLRSMFKGDIRAFIPQIAMSAGTMIACSCRKIFMGKHSSIGPIDPQINGIPAHGIMTEFQRAMREIKADNEKALVWGNILRQVQPGILTECERAFTMSKTLVKQWLVSGMLESNPDKDDVASRIVEQLADASVNLSHGRHINADTARSFGLDVIDLESDQNLQDAVLSVHHCAVQTLESTFAYKIIENHNGIAYIQTARPTIQAIPS